MAVNLHATHFRFGVDELAENTHGWYANEDVNPSSGAIPLDTVFLLRFNVQETGGTAAGNTDFTWQFQINGGGFVNLTTTSVGPRAVAAAALTNGGNCTKRLSGTGTFESSGAGQTEDGTSGGTANDIAASGCSETECGIIIDSADVSAGDVIQFRLTSPDFTITNDVVPSITIAATPTRGRISFAELEAPFQATRGRISFAEMEVPIAPTRGRIAWSELETPSPVGSPTRGRVSVAELEVPFQATRGRISWAEIEAPVASTRGRLSWAEFETPLAPTRGLTSFAELEMPGTPTRGRISFAELQVPNLGAYTGRTRGMLANVGSLTGHR